MAFPVPWVLPVPSPCPLCPHALVSQLPQAMKWVLARRKREQVTHQHGHMPVLSHQSPPHRRRLVCDEPARHVRMEDNERGRPHVSQVPVRAQGSYAEVLLGKYQLEGLKEQWGTEVRGPWGTPRVRAKGSIGTMHARGGSLGGDPSIGMRSVQDEAMENLWHHYGISGRGRGEQGGMLGMMHIWLCRRRSWLHDALVP